MVKLSKQWFYYLASLFLATVGTIAVWTLPQYGFILGSGIFSVGCYFYFLGYKLEKKGLRKLPLEDRADTSNRNINTNGGSYNELVQGDCITIQGNQIYIGQDLSQFLTQIKEVLNQLQNQGCSAEGAEKQVVKDLETQAHSNLRFRKKIYRWKKSLGISNKFINEIEVAKKIVETANETTSSSSGTSIFVIGGRYKKLYDLLEAGKWKEADKETLIIILGLMPKRGYRYIDVDEIPPGDLKRVNQLWIRYSNGRFGFSVQKHIWKKVSKAYPSANSWNDERTYYAFIDCVGWSIENDRLYPTDIKYSLSAPRGHLPALLMFATGYSSSNYRHFNKGVFDALMQRNYDDESSIPLWLKQ